MMTGRYCECGIKRALNSKLFISETEYSITRFDWLPVVIADQLKSMGMFLWQYQNKQTNSFPGSSQTEPCGA